MYAGKTWTRVKLSWSFQYCSPASSPHPPFTEGKSCRQLCTTCKPHPTQETLWSCLPCGLPSHRGSSYHYYLPCQTINITPKHITKEFSHNSNLAHFSLGLHHWGCVLVAYLHHQNPPWFYSRTQQMRMLFFIPLSHHLLSYKKREFGCNLMKHGRPSAHTVTCNHASHVNWTPWQLRQRNLYPAPVVKV